MTGKETPLDALMYWTFFALWSLDNSNTCVYEYMKKGQLKVTQNFASTQGTAN